MTKPAGQGSDLRVVVARGGVEPPTFRFSGLRKGSEGPVRVRIRAQYKGGGSCCVHLPRGWC